MKPPKEIFLQFEEQDSEFGATWCVDQINETDVRYVLVDPLDNAPEGKLGDCSACGDEEMLLVKSEQGDEPLHYVCKECFLRGY